LWEPAYNITVLGRYFPAHLFPQLFEEEGVNRDVYFRALRMLTALGVISPEDPSPHIPVNDPAIYDPPVSNPGPYRKEKILSSVRKTILGWVKSDKLRQCFNLLRILSELGDHAADVPVIKSLRADVVNGTFSGIEEALEQNYFARLVGAGNAPVLLYIYKTMKALVWGEGDRIDEVFQEPVPALTLRDGKPCCDVFRAHIQINLGSFYLGSGNIDAASEAIREAMLLNRNLGEDAVPAYRLFALVNFARQRIDDALEYISFAVEQAEKAEQPEELSLTYYYASTVNFVYGNLSKAERLIQKAEEYALKVGQSGWAAKARFFKGRLNFEIGRYGDALKIFESIEDNAGTVKAWISRTKAFLSRLSLSDAGSEASAFAGYDGRSFETEAAYYAGEYEKAAAMANAFILSPEEKQARFLLTEQPDWRSGFDQCECLFMPGKSQGKKIAFVYRAMAQFAIRQSRAEKKEILDSMQRFIRDELFPDTDPHDGFYFYSWYRMLSQVSAAETDINTVISMAYKRLQRRAARIDNIETKQEFLSLPRWNNLLSLAARDHKII
jgi:tetratricopeptide (TPR) repeat protein